MWVVWALEVLFAAPFGNHLVFKGGTSLPKAYDVSARFSEDVDLTYDVRTIAPDLAEPGSEAIPANPSQEQKWTKPVVLLEFGARSTGEPSEPRSVTCDAAAHVLELVFPSATPATMRPERTFWEKATAIHVCCLGGKLRGDDPVSRHWHDVVALDQAGFAATAIVDRALAATVARRKNACFRERHGGGAYVDYAVAVSGGLQLVPDGDRLTLLADDYQRMVADGLLFSTPPRFSSLVSLCLDIQNRANAAAR